MCIIELPLVVISCEWNVEVQATSWPLQESKGVVTVVSFLYTSHLDQDEIHQITIFVSYVIIGQHLERFQT